MLNYFDFYVFEITILGHLKNENLDFFIVFLHVDTHILEFKIGATILTN